MKNEFITEGFNTLVIISEDLKVSLISRLKAVVAGDGISTMVSMN